MTKTEHKIFEENFDENWENGEPALAAILHEWKTRKFTRREMVERMVDSLEQVENAAEMQCFMVAMLAERLIKAEDEQHITE